MKKNLLRLGAMSALLVTSLSATAIDPPQIPAQVLTDGGKYVLMNKAAVAPCMYRTNWDGAFFYAGTAGSGNAVSGSTYFDNQLEAKKNEDGTWSFIMTTPAAEEGAEPTTTYFCIPTNSGNLNMSENYASWNVTEGNGDKFYRLSPAEGSMEGATGYQMHLNKGNDYIIISYFGSDFYPDFNVKTRQDVDGNTEYAFMNNGVEDWWTGEIKQCENLVWTDSTSLDWAFVKAESIEEYAAINGAYNAIVNCTENYAVIEGYEAGFQASIDAATAVYTASDFSIDEVETVTTLISAKIALYEEIVKATEANVDDDAALNGSIANAKAIFDTVTTPIELANATETLAEAVKNYQLGGGDLTGLGKNMSFEDLTAQDGQPTSGVGNPPAGWNLYLNGVLMTSADDIRGQGVGTWCGVNADCNGAGKDGSYGFGIWNSGIPTVEISQTIEGLENGTYTVSAGLMVGANGNGSRRTTQRIFGNLNSAYFGNDFEYDHSLLDASEVYSFAGLTEPVTDQELQPISVRAYVYDGTLTFGFRTDGNIAAALRDASNSAGGDGWFKIDNFRIQKEGYIADDAIAVFSQYMNTLSEYEAQDPIIYNETKELLESKVKEFDAITSESSQEEINAAIVEAREIIITVSAAMKAYQKLSDAIEEHYNYLAEYEAMPGAGTYSDEIAEVEGNYYDGIYTNEEIDAAIARLDAALDACKLSEITPDKDITYIINNPSFENWSATQTNNTTGGVENAPKGWTLIINGDTCVTRADVNAHGISAWCAINLGDGINVELEDGTIVTKQPTEGDHLWGIWNASIPEVELSQTFTNLPAGTYTLTADVMVQNNWAGDNITTQRIFANNSIQMFGSEEAHAINLPADAQSAAARDAANPDSENKFLTYAGYTCMADDRTTDLLHTMTVVFGVDDSGIAKIGFRTNGINTDGLTLEEGGRNGQGWFKVDNFTLYYNSEEVPTGVENIKTNGAVTTISSRQFFTIGGAQVSAPQKGVNIVKNVMSDGTVKVSKVIVK